VAQATTNVTCTPVTGQLQVGKTKMTYTQALKKNEKFYCLYGQTTI